MRTIPNLPENNLDSLITGIEKRQSDPHADPHPDSSLVFFPPVDKAEPIHHDDLASIAGGLAHYVNNSLAVILGGLELSTDQKSLEYWKENMQKSSYRIARVIKGLLYYTGQGRYDVQEQDMNSVVLQTISLYQTNNPQVTVLRDIKAESPRIEADLDNLTFALTEIYRNAGESMGGKGVMGVSTRNTTYSGSNHVMVSIWDNGRGIPKDRIEDAFRMFSTTKPSNEHTGIGLPASYALLKKNGGDMGMISTDTGTTVLLYLPAK